MPADALALLKAEKKRLLDLEKQKILPSQQMSLNEKKNEREEIGLNSMELFSSRLLPLPFDFSMSVIDDRIRNSVKLYPNILTEEEEAFLLRNINDPGKASWQLVRNRRLQCFGGDPVPGAARTALPDWLYLLAKFIENTAALEYKIDHVLLNEYKVGQGILPHTDGPSYFPCVACVSLGATADMIFQTKLSTQEIGKVPSKHLARITLPPRSLVLFWGFAYENALHSIENVRDGIVRISLTMRKMLM